MIFIEGRVRALCVPCGSRVILTAVVALAACAPPAPEPAAARSPSGSSPEPTDFVNKVWAVSESAAVQVGSLRVWLSDGTLVMSDPNSTPAFGTWSRDDSGLVMIEEGIAYKVDILELTPGTFRIRIHSPGQPLDMTLVPAAPP